MKNNPNFYFLIENIFLTTFIINIDNAINNYYKIM